jgi:polysaccharide chain length determinant protein (PEP-CTERM system associated)
MNTKLIFYYLQGIWRRRWIVAAICWAICIAGWAGVFELDDVYESQARVYVDVDSLLTPLLRGLAVEANPLQQLDYMQRTLLSRPNLEQVIHLADLDSQAKTPQDKEDLLKTLASDVKIGLQGNNLFAITYHDDNPIEGKNIVQAVLTVFSETSAGNNRTEMDTARRFLEEQIANYERQLRAAETRRAQFREQYGDVLPQDQANRTRMSQLGDELQKLNLTLQDAQGRRDEIAKEVVNVPQTLTLDQAAQVIVNAGGQPAPGDTQAQLADDKRKLLELRSRYTDDFPDIVALKRDIVSLESENKAAADASAKDAKADPKANGKVDGKADPNAAPAPIDRTRRSTVSNPVYEQLQLRLADADASIASIQRQIKASIDEKASLDTAIKAAPGIELQAQNLDRDYEILKKNYDELVSRRESANLAQAADTQADKVQFRIVDAPQVPLTPIAPNRPLLYTGVLMAGLGSGVAAAFLLMQLDRSFSNVASLRELGLPVLGTISRVVMINVRRRIFREVGGLAASAAALLLVYGTLLLANVTSFRGMI